MEISVSNCKTQHNAKKQFGTIQMIRDTVGVGGGEAKKAPKMCHLFFNGSLAWLIKKLINTVYGQRDISCLQLKSNRVQPPQTMEEGNYKGIIFFMFENIFLYYL